ncbi:MAG: radical SAM protein, partial [Desulfobacteraceae bacterium]
SPAYNHLEELPWPALDLVSRLTYAPVMTSRGCPFACDYCASSFLQPDFQQRSPDSVFQEIRHWHVNHGAANFAFYDDALLVNQEALALPLFEKIIASGMKIAFHTPNALHIREITRQNAALMFKAGFHTIRLGLETADFSPSRRHDGKVAGKEFTAALDHLKTAGFDSSQIGAYLLCGLPDQNLSEVKASVLAVKEHGITPVLAYYTPIPHTPMWQRAVEQSRFDLEKDPVFTNNALFPCLDKGMETKSISRLKNLSP